MSVYDHAGHEVYAEDVLDREELADYYDRHGIAWRPDPETTEEEEASDDRDH